MRLLTAIITLLYLTAAAGSATPTQLEPRQTFAVITGVLEWPYAKMTLDGFSKTNRRDQGLYDTIIARGVPKENIVLLLDGDCTEANMRKALEDVAGRAERDSLFIFYYAGHGYTGSEGIYFAPHDVGKEGGPMEGFLLRNVSQILKRHYRGSRVLLMADCCHAGALGDEAKLLGDAGFEAVSMTASSIDNSSGSDWIFSCAMIDVFKGRTLCDRNGDGFITIKEAHEEIRDAMHFYGQQNYGFERHNMDDTFRLAKVTETNSAASIPSPYKLGQYVRHKEQELTARIVGEQEGKLHLEQQRYHDRNSFLATVDEITEVDRPVFPPVTMSTLRDPEGALSSAAGKEKATVNGKYSDLLQVVPARFDYLAYGIFKDYGNDKTSRYLGSIDLPPGYWVYVYPNWYIFEKGP